MSEHQWVLEDIDELIVDVERTREDLDTCFSEILEHLKEIRKKLSERSDVHPLAVERLDFMVQGTTDSLESANGCLDDVVRLLDKLHESLNQRREKPETVSLASVIEDIYQTYTEEHNDD